MWVYLQKFILYLRITEEIPVRCYMLWLADVYFIHVPLVFTSDVYLVALFRLPRYTDFKVRLTSGL